MLDLFAVFLVGLISGYTIGLLSSRDIDQEIYDEYYAPRRSPTSGVPELRDRERSEAEVQHHQNDDR